MGNKVKAKYPTYFKEFKCIGGECKDSCCIGWDIDIDKITFKQYFKVKDPEMKRMFQKNVQNKENYECDEVDYGKVKLKGEKRCPFLDDCNYCVIHSKLGEEYLSNVCTSFPRIINIIDGIYEMSLDVACPEAARIILSIEDGIKFTESEETLKKHIISSETDTQSKRYKESPIRYFSKIRKKSIEIIQNRNLTLNERMYMLGEFTNSLEDEINSNFNNVIKFVENYDINEIKEDYYADDMRYLLQIDFFKNMIDLLDVFNEVDGDVFKNNTKEIIDAFKLKEEDNLSKYAKEFVKAFEECNEKFMDKYEYIFENYLVNLMYKNMFPFSETDSVFDGYIMLLTKYAFIRFYLVGLYMAGKINSKEDIIDLIQVFTKTIEHHRNYLANSMRYIRQKEFDNLEFAKVLI